MYLDLVRQQLGKASASSLDLVRQQLGFSSSSGRGPWTEEQQAFLQHVPQLSDAVRGHARALLCQEWLKRFPASRVGYYETSRLLKELCMLRFLPHVRQDTAYGHNYDPSDQLGEHRGLQSYHFYA